jgi:hypothetical protein
MTFATFAFQTMIKVLGLALYGPLAASTRYRLSQYVSGLASMGIDLQVRHLLGDDYLRRRFEGGGLAISPILSGSLHRFKDLIRLNTFDVAIIYCELFPLMPAWLELQLMRLPFIYDFDDAFYLKYRNFRFETIQPLIRYKFDNLIRAASGITAGNRVLADYARQFNQHISLLPTVVDTTRFVPNVRLRNSRPFTIGWIGSPSTAPYLAQLVPPLTQLGVEGPVRFLIVGGKAPSVPHVEIIEIAWNEGTDAVTG